LGPLHIGPVVTITHEADALGDHLIIACPALAEKLLGGGEVFAVAEGTFIVRAGNISVNFTENKKGKVTGLVLRLNDSVVRLGRTGNLPQKRSVAPGWEVTRPCAEEPRGRLPLARISAFGRARVAQVPS
jgi:hypothetical protein